MWNYFVYDESSNKSVHQVKTSETICNFRVAGNVATNMEATPENGTSYKAVIQDEALQKESKRRQQFLVQLCLMPSNSA